MTEITTALEAAFGTWQVALLSLLAAAVPVACVVIGAKTVILSGIKMFKQIVNK